MKFGLLATLAVISTFLVGCAESSNVSQDNSSPAAISMPEKSDSNSHISTYGSADLQTTVQGR